MKLTRERIESLRTDAGGFTANTMIGLGVTSKPEKGWLDRLIGKELKHSKFAQLHEEKDLLKKVRKRAVVTEQIKREVDSDPLLQLNIQEVIDHINKYFDEKAREYIKARI